MHAIAAIAARTQGRYARDRACKRARARPTAALCSPSAFSAIAGVRVQADRSGEALGVMRWRVREAGADGGEASNLAPGLCSQLGRSTTTDVRIKAYQPTWPTFQTSAALFQAERRRRRLHACTSSDESINSTAPDVGAAGLAKEHQAVACTWIQTEHLHQCEPQTTLSAPASRPAPAGQRACIRGSILFSPAC